MNGICIFDANSSNNKAKINGDIKFYQPSRFESTKIAINLTGFKPDSTNAIHIHEYGNTKSCMDSGGHFNPHNKNHGYYLLDGDNRHAGDLINNIVSDRSGNVNITFDDNLVNLSGPYSVIGRTVVIHEKPDDLGRGGDAQSLITGNAGGRMACAVIGIDKTEAF
jgi:superoxide dismutase, Cu-Zn family